MEREPSGHTRPFDLILWGATGFTGRLVAEYLLRRTPLGREGAPRIALAGRNEEKLRALREELAGEYPAAANLELRCAQIDSAESLDRLCREGRVICSVVGPYARYGSSLVAACVRAGSHYCDLSGEVHWIRSMIDAHHRDAEAARVKLVHCCGFDSIPSDIAVMTLVDAFAAEEQRRRRQESSAGDAPTGGASGAINEASEELRIRAYFGPLRGGISGGTVASLLGALEAAKERPVRRILADPYSLCPGAPRGRDRGEALSLVKLPDYPPRGGWRAPFLMAPVNAKVVRRSASLLSERYGALRYSEALAFPRGLRGLRRAALMTAGLGIGIGLLSWSPTRALLRRFILPKPGSGPSPEARAAGHFRLLLLGERGGLRRSLELRARLDPGYGGTAVMLAEAALCLAFDDEQAPQRWGSLTPAAALGVPLRERLERSGFEFKLSPETQLPT